MSWILLVIFFAQGPRAVYADAPQDRVWHVSEDSCQSYRNIWLELNQDQPLLSKQAVAVCVRTEDHQKPTDAGA